MVILGIRVTLACGLGAGVSGVVFPVKISLREYRTDGSYFWMFQSIYNFTPKTVMPFNTTREADEMIMPKEEESRLQLRT